jgi:hypothetical protein
LSQLVTCRENSVFCRNFCVIKGTVITSVCASCNSTGKRERGNWNSWSSFRVIVGSAVPIFAYSEFVHEIGVYPYLPYNALCVLWMNWVISRLESLQMIALQNVEFSLLNCKINYLFLRVDVNKFWVTYLVLLSGVEHLSNII